MKIETISDLSSFKNNYTVLLCIRLLVHLFIGPFVMLS